MQEKIETSAIQDKDVFQDFFQKNIVFNLLFTATIVRLIWNFLFGFRWPSAWVLANSVFTYDYGFIPRGLLPSVLKVLFGRHIYSLKFLYILIVGTGVSITVAFGYMSYYYNIKKKNIIGGILIFWYSLSIYSAYLSHEMGYCEQYGYILVCFLLLLPVSKIDNIRFSLIGSGIMVITVLISETNVFLVCPMIIYICVFRILDNPVTREHLGQIKRELTLFITFNIPTFILCAFIGLTTVPKDRILRITSLIRSHSDKFEECLDNAAQYFYNGRMQNYVKEGNIKVWNWQLMCYLFLFVFLVAVVLIYARYYKKALNYILGCFLMMLCVYSLNFIAWDTERFKFGIAIMITFASVWTLKQIDVKRIVINKDIVYILLLGTMCMAAIMDYRLGLFDKCVYNTSIKQFIETLHSTWRINY